MSLIGQNALFFKSLIILNLIFQFVNGDRVNVGVILDNQFIGDGTKFFQEAAAYSSDPNFQLKYAK